MRTLFVKLFLWFLLAIIVSGVVFFFFAFNLRMAPMREEHMRHIHEERTRTVTQALLLAGRAAAALQEKGGRAALAGLQPQGEGGLKLYLFTDQAVPISDGVPTQVWDGVRLFSETGHTAPGAPGGRDIVVVRVAAPSGTRYLAATRAIPLPGPPDGLRFPFPPDFWLQMAITLVVSALVCFGLSWHITAPVRRLRLAVQGFALGDLATRVAVTGAKSGDELTDLGRDFNLMAIRIEKLVNAHKQLVRDVSHELRSPLARLNVALGIARNQSCPGQEAALDRIEQESERLNVLVGELLTLSQLDGGVTGEKTRFDLTLLAEEVASDAHFEASGCHRRVEIVSASPSLPVEGNRELLRRALENVFRNAVRYTPEGSSVQLRLAVSDGWAVVTVRDFGPGVPDDQLSDIFRPFHRVADARDRKSGGTGIGLAISERAVTLHGGTIVATNAPGGGLQVEIKLPLTEKR
ncbi:two-component sensor histidine kinase [Geomonas sp. Red276]